VKKDLDTLNRLIVAPGPSGNEGEVQEIFLDLMGPYVKRQWADPVGNCYSKIDGNPEKPVIMFTAHCDTVGFLVKYIDDRGFLFTQDIPGWDTMDYRSLPGQDVVVLCRKDGKQLHGHFTPVIPVHMMRGEDFDEAIERYDLAIDIGVSTEAEAKRHVSVGDYVLLKSSPRLSDNKKQLISTNLDDRLGMYCMYQIAKSLSRTKRANKCPVVFASTVCEESVSGSVQVLAVNAEPTISITLEVEPATDSIIHNAEYAIAKQHGIIRLGGGPVITRGISVDDGVFQRLEKLAQKHELPHQIALSEMATDNVFIQQGGKGVRTALVSVPLRNCHTRVETTCLKDIDLTVDLCLKYIRYVDSHGLV
jgi:endoglucanase